LHLKHAKIVEVLYGWAFSAEKNDMKRIVITLMAGLMAFTAAEAAPKKAKKKARKPASAQKAPKKTESERLYCESVIDGILARNGLGTFRKPDDQKVKMPRADGTGFVFKSRAMKKGEGVYVYAPKKDGSSRVRVAYFHRDGKKRNLNFQLTKKCALKEVSGIYGPTADRYSITKNACSFTAKNPSRRPASDATALKRKSKKELASRKKENSRLKRLGARFPTQGAGGIYELCEAYGTLFTRAPAKVRVAAKKKKLHPLAKTPKEPQPDETILPPSDLLQEQIALTPEDPYAPGTPPPAQPPLNREISSETTAALPDAPEAAPSAPETGVAPPLDHGEPPATE